jgi:bacteriocin-like protein
MKTPNIQKKLSKNELKTITGSLKGVMCEMEGLCIVRGTDEIQVGLLDKFGFCC